MNQKLVEKIGWFASLMAILMYGSYIDQIQRNISGAKGSLILPIATTINCIAWFAYGALKEKKDWPIIICNALGVVLGIVTALTVLF